MSAGAASFAVSVGELGTMLDLDKDNKKTTSTLVQQMKEQGCVRSCCLVRAPLPCRRRRPTTVANI